MNNSFESWWKEHEKECYSVFDSAEAAWDAQQKVIESQAERIHVLETRLDLEGFKKDVFEGYGELEKEIDRLREALEKCSQAFHAWDGGGVTSGHYFQLMEAKQAVREALQLSKKEGDVK